MKTQKNQLLLIKDVDGLGRSGDVVTAKPGFIRNYLLPKKLARSEEHTSELQSHSFISYAVFCLKKKNSHPPPPFTNSCTLTDSCHYH